MYGDLNPSEKLVICKCSICMRSPWKYNLPLDIHSQVYVEVSGLSTIECPYR